MLIPFVVSLNHEWNQLIRASLSEYLDSQDTIEMQSATWSAAARQHYDLRKQVLTVRLLHRPALENQLLLIHDDRDFITISQVVPLNQKQWALS